MDALLTLGIGFLTTIVAFIVWRFFKIRIDVLILQITLTFMVIIPLSQMMFVYFTNPSGLAGWSNSYISMLVQQLPEEMIGEVGGNLAGVLIAKFVNPK